MRDETFMRELFARAPEGLITIIVARNLEFGAFAAGLFLRDATGIRYWNAGGELAARALSPGILLFAHGLQMAISERKQTFDFLRGNESYKYEVGATDVDVLMITVPAA
jgi:CelD/BcsL family acetyltransferase involved in cellulose biosynthesis